MDRQGASSWAVIAGAVVTLVVAIGWWWRSSPQDMAPATAPPGSRVTDTFGPQASAAPPAGSPQPVTAPAPARLATLPPPPAPRIPRTREGGDPTPDLSDYINEGERPTMAEVIERLHQAGIRSGLGAFQPPGTRPPLEGLAVPEDFELPDGYVRHHQATDDGQPIEAILMFAPGRAFVDAAGQPVAIPADRVVPPELAPPGLPIRRISIPRPLDAER